MRTGKASSESREAIWFQTSTKKKKKKTKEDRPRSIPQVYLGFKEAEYAGGGVGKKGT